MAAWRTSLAIFWSDRKEEYGQVSKVVTPSHSCLTSRFHPVLMWSKWKLEHLPIRSHMTPVLKWHKCIWIRKLLIGWLSDTGLKQGVPVCKLPYLMIFCVTSECFIQFFFPRFISSVVMQPWFPKMIRLCKSPIQIYRKVLKTLHGLDSFTTFWYRGSLYTFL